VAAPGRVELEPDGVATGPFWPSLLVSLLEILLERIVTDFQF
jgi:hypothetical protein